MTKRDLRRRVDTWHFWVGIAYFAIVAVIVALWVNYNQVSRDQSRTAQLVAARHADVVANADAQYIQCVKSIPTLTRINLFLNGVQSVDGVLLKNSLAVHSVTPAGPTFQAQIKNIARLRRALHDVSGVRFPVPSAASCVVLRNRLQENK